MANPLTAGVELRLPADSSDWQGLCKGRRPGRIHAPAFGGFAMLMTLVVVLIVLWLLGMVTSYTLGGILHILLVVAIVLFLVGLISGRRTIP